MLGWTILFALMALSSGAGVVTMAEHPPLFLKIAGGIFAGLFLLNLLTRAIRRWTTT